MTFAKMDGFVLPESGLFQGNYTKECHLCFAIIIIIIFGGGPISTPMCGFEMYWGTMIHVHHFRGPQVSFQPKPLKQ